MHRHWSVSILMIAVLALTLACSDEEPSGPQGPFQLTFQGDATFQGPHGSQMIYVAVVNTTDDEVVARASGTVSGTADPAFSFTFPNLLDQGSAYQVHYWIDSNFGGGTVGVCDPMANDHQWSVDVAAVTAAVTVTETHTPAATSAVCPSFSAGLAFSGDATFQGPHGGQMMYVAVVRASDGLAVARASATVSGTANPSFSFDFPGLLVAGVAYQLHYWIDSNFGGGTVGVCDPKANDHQWSLDIAEVTTDVTLGETHNPAATTDVCQSFTASLTFSGDASFQGAHGGQTVSVGLVRSSDGLVVARQSGTVSGTANPSFSFTFADQLVIGESYQVHYWMDSNFGGGTVGVCDPPSVDHQWSVNTGSVVNNLDIEEVHAPANVTDVCSTFP